MMDVKGNYIVDEVIEIMKRDGLDIEKVDALYTKAGGDDAYQEWANEKADAILEKWYGTNEYKMLTFDEAFVEAIAYLMQVYYEMLRRKYGSEA